MTDTSRSDDLVERLRSVDVSWSETGEWCAEAADRIEALEAENERLTDCLAKANAQAEHFEREWYLRADRIEALEAENERLRREDWFEQFEEQEQLRDDAEQRLSVVEAEVERLRGALEQFLALIKHQYFGSREAMNDLQEADNAARAALGEKQ